MNNIHVIHALLAAALFGASTPFAKLLVGEMSPWLLAGLLYLGSGLGLAVAPLVRVRPNISASGPSTPPKKIAPSSHGHSPLARPDGVQPRSRIRRATASPSPLPR